MGLSRPRRVRRRRPAAWLRAAGIAAPLLVVVWVAGLVRFGAAIPPQATDADARTDAVVVLTGGADRVDAGLRLIAEGRAAKLFVSGVYRGVDVAALLRLSRTAPENVECCVVLGYTADSTAGNARESAQWMAKEGFASLRLVTASYHMPRSLLEFRRAMPQARIVPHPVVPERFRQEAWWRFPGTLSLVISEYDKYLIALLRGPLDRLLDGA
jgi:uncharacterized SAM-binding protein YcdF (DUF218 family)